MTVSIIEEHIARILRSERRWAIAEMVALWLTRACVAAFMVGLVSAATVVVLDAYGVPERSVTDGAPR